MKKNIKFEEAMELLEKEVGRLESGNMPLDEALSSFETAISLVKICNERLEAAESKVRILTESSSGEVTDAPFLNTDDEN